MWRVHVSCKRSAQRAIMRHLVCVLGLPVVHIRVYLYGAIEEVTPEELADRQDIIYAIVRLPDELEDFKSIANVLMEGDIKQNIALARKHEMLMYVSEKTAEAFVKPAVMHHKQFTHVLGKDWIVVEPHEWIGS